VAKVRRYLIPELSFAHRKARDNYTPQLLVFYGFGSLLGIKVHSCINFNFTISLLLPFTPSPHTILTVYKLTDELNPIK